MFAATKITEVAYQQERRFGASEPASASALLLGPDRELLLQRRDITALVAPGMLALFGGRAEPGETLLETALRELQEELDLSLSARTATLIGCVALEQPHRNSLSGRFFWRLDRLPQQCHEGRLETYATVEIALAEPSLTLCARWTIERCRQLGLLA